MTDATTHVIRVIVEVDGRRASSEIEVEGDAECCDALDPAEMADALITVAATMLGVEGDETDPDLDLPPVFGGGEGQPS